MTPCHPRPRLHVDVGQRGALGTRERADLLLSKGEVLALSKGEVLAQLAVDRPMAASISDGVITNARTIFGSQPSSSRE